MSGVAVALPEQAARSRSRLDRVALIGNPNTGKTTTFNRLCGARAKTSNFPGTTTATRLGRSEISPHRAVEIIDLPGVYELHFDAPESLIARAVLEGDGAFRRPDAAIVIVDACNLTRNLVLVGELLQYEVPVVVGLNMLDIAQRRGLTVNAGLLARRLGVAVVPMVARRGEGLGALKAALARALDEPAAKRPDDLPDGSGSVEALTAWADELLAEAAGVSALTDSRVDGFTERMDSAFTNPFVGLLTFAAVMGGLFWALFALATVPMDLIEATFARLGQFVVAYLPAGPLRDLLTDGIISGIAGTIVFLPQICLLFFLISLL
jgi:ferrous iron transport protein B